MDEPTPAAPAAPKRRFPLWTLACCGGCFLFVLIPVALLAWVFASFTGALEDARKPEVQQQTYDEAIRNVGAPPGWRVELANRFPFFHWPIVVFVPESAPRGDLEEVLRGSFAMLWRIDEDEGARRDRERLFGEGEVQRAPDFLEKVIPHGEIVITDRGKIPGHLFGLPYVIGTVESRNRDESRRVEIGMVDLTPPTAEGEQTGFLLVHVKGQPLTAGDLEALCRNFRPGE